MFTFNYEYDVDIILLMIYLPTWFYPDGVPDSLFSGYPKLPMKSVDIQELDTHKFHCMSGKNPVICGPQITPCFKLSLLLDSQTFSHIIMDTLSLNPGTFLLRH